MQLEHQKIAQPSQQQITSDVIRYSGIPQITLYFKGVDKTILSKPKPLTGEKSFRFMGYTDNPAIISKRSDLQLITELNIKRIGNKILSVFRTNPPFVWKKGKKQVIYHDWMRGYNLDVYASSYAEGDRLIAAILSLQDHQVDETFVKYSEAKNPNQAYPPATDYQVLGKTHTKSERLPTAEVVFQYAKIYLPTIKEDRVIA